MRFMMLLYPGEEPALSVPDASAAAAMLRYREELTRAGVLLSVDGLEPGSAGVCIRFPQGKPTVVAGPLVKATAEVGGYLLLQVKSRAEAIEWAKRCPAREPAVLELRQVREPLDPSRRTDHSATAPTPADKLRPS